MKKQKAISLLLIVGMLTAGFVGCGQAAESDVTSTITGQVTAIEDDTITLALGDLNEMPTGDQQADPSGEAATSDAAMQAPPDGQNTAPDQNGAPGGPGEAGEMPGNPGDQDQAGGTPPTPPEGLSEGTSGGAVSGDMQQAGERERGSRITLTGEEQQITITDETTILINNMGESAEGSLSDITTGSILSVTMTGDTVTEVIIISSLSNDAMPQGDVTDGADESAE